LCRRKIQQLQEIYMNKKLIVLTIAFALTAPALAYAEATVYGQANMSIDRVNDGMATSSTNNQLNSNASRLGFKGSEDLGNGMSVVWVLEADVALDTGVAGNGAGTLFSRAANIGLTSDSMGTVAVGRQDSPYKASTRRLDMFGDTAADNHAGGLMMTNSHDGGPNAISYASPSMSGFSVVAASVFGAEGGTAVAPNNKKGSALGLAGRYEQGPIYVALAYDGAKFGDAGTGDLGVAVDDESKAVILGGSYAMDAFAVNAAIEKLTDKVAIGSVETTGTNLYLAGKFNISSTDAAKLAYTKRGETKTGGTNNADAASQVSVGYDHNMSKATWVYALYTKVTQDGTLADPSVLSFGIKHSF
jgi:predicted porin